MKLYHYIQRPHTAHTDGILSFSCNRNADISYYIKRSGCTTHTDIANWMENCFIGRSRGIRAFIEPLQPSTKAPSVQQFINQSDLFEIDVSALQKGGLLEAVYHSPSVLTHPPQNKSDETLYKLNSINEIDFTPNDYTRLNDKKGYRFAFLRYYLLVLKNGVIPPQYIKHLK